MQRKPRKKRRACKNCGVRFSGRYCPYCGAESGHRNTLRSSGFFIGLLRFLLSLVVLAIVLVLAFVLLDYVAASGEGAHTTAIAIVDSVKNALPKEVLLVYSSMKETHLDALFAWTQKLLG